MASLLERAIRNYRAELLRSESQALAQVIAAYRDVRISLIKRIDELAAAIEKDGRALTVGELWQDTRAKALLRQVEAEMAALAVRMQPVVLAGQEATVGLAADHALGLTVVNASTASAAAAAQIATSWNRLNAGAVEALLGRMSNGAPLDLWLNAFGSDASAIMRREITSAVALGRNPRALAAQLAKSVDVSGARLLTFSRTEILGSYRNAARESHLANQDILSKVMWVASLSENSCGACLAMSGQTFDLDYKMETHPNCRCTLIAVVKGIDAPELPSGEDYFASLPSAKQDAVLGPASAEAYRSGRVSLPDFIQRDENPTWGASIRQGSLSSALARSDRIAA